MADTMHPAAQLLELPTLQKVCRSGAITALAAAIGFMLIAVPLGFVFVPWQQTVPGAGRVVALDPRQRIQTIPAPVTGRLVKLYAQEGQRVVRGELLAELEDQDPSFLLRLQEQLTFSRDKVEQAHQSLEFYQQKVINLQLEKDSANAKARADLGAALEKVKQAEQDVVAKEAEINIDKRPNYERQRDLMAIGATSERVAQAAEAGLRAAEAQLAAARAKVDEARSEEQSKMAAIDEVDAKFAGDINAAEAEVRTAVQKLREAQTDLAQKQSEVSRQETQTVAAPMDGTVLFVHGATSQDLISRGAPLIDFVPISDQLAVELIVKGVDAPLITTQRRARITFEGWPAVQFAGWPSVAVGTFGGIVHLVDSQARPDGSVRALIVPDPSDEKWPDPPFLRQGVRASGWVQLDTVSVGYEVWRRLNAFPPTVAMQPSADGSIPKQDSKEDEKSK